MEYLIPLFLAYRMRATLVEEADVKKWSAMLTYIMVGCGLFFLIKNGSGAGHILKWGAYFILFFLSRIIFRTPVFAEVKPIMISLLPLSAVYFVSDLFELIVPRFHDSISNIFEVGRAVGIAWLIGSYILFRKQQKALEQERKLREAEVIENKRNAIRKAELEQMVQERTAEIVAQNEKLQQALQELSAAQAQLIHSEKMASLGELTAGIAHEIQNPLNFINNFSELNSELAAELTEALAQNDLEEAKLLAGDIQANQEKVVHHGKRADSIVKSMLQHSRGTGNSRESIDINNLADECIRLSYHGMRAKERSFNAKMETSFDPGVGQVEVVPGDINRVLLNICTNAFYAVQQKARESSNGFQPTVWLTTRALPHAVEITIKDNGNGIPEAVKEKIFQPFFTTKPTGEGTGLGLSMSYEIITKGHSGTIRVESSEGKGAAFIINIPKNQEN